ncbi:hypothetical protein ACFL6D_01510 [Spirochaetota bacterium]
MRSLIFITVLIALNTYSHAQTLVYKNYIGKNICTNTYRIETVGIGYIVTFISQMKNNEERYMEIAADSSFFTLSWIFINKKKEISIFANRRGDIIFLSGLFNGKQVHKQYYVGREPWNQFIPLAFEKYVIWPDRKPLMFWAIGIEKPGALQIGRFYIKSITEDVITVNYEKVKTFKITITFDDWKSQFWKGHYWHRYSDGRYLRFKGKSKISTPIVTEFMREGTD